MPAWIVTAAGSLTQVATDCDDTDPHRSGNVCPAMDTAPSGSPVIVKVGCVSADTSNCRETARVPCTEMARQPTSAGTAASAMDTVPVGPSGGVPPEHPMATQAPPRTIAAMRELILAATQ